MQRGVSDIDWMKTLFWLKMIPNQLSLTKFNMMEHQLVDENLGKKRKQWIQMLEAVKTLLTN